LAKKRTKAEALERLAEARSVTGRAPVKGRVKAVHDLAYLGAAGLIMLDPMNRLADERIVLPLDMVCIPAYQAYMIQGSPSMQIYIRAGETIIPTGGNVKDVQEALDDVPEPSMERLRDTTVRKSKRNTPYQRAYKKAFKSIAPKYKLKNGKWKKDGFKAAVKAAHKKAKGMK
jgi:hypothetical protein